MNNKNALDDTIKFLTENAVIIDRLYNFIIADDGFNEKCNPEVLKALKCNIIHLSDNIDLAMQSVIEIENSSYALEFLLREFIIEMNYEY